MSPGASLWLLLTLSLSLPPPQAAAPPPPSPEVSWGDWLIVDEAEPGASILLRRITPKSVFIAPTVCSDGYRQDAMGRCVKVVKINQQAQWKLLLERLNSMYAPPAGPNPQKEAGPFHISLPLGSDGSHEDNNVKKRVPPPGIRDDHVTTTSTTTIKPATTTTTTTLPTTTLISDTPTSEVSTTDPTDSTTERRDVSTESLFADQPAVTEPDLPDKPFVIIVTNKPTTRAEETTVPTTLTSTEPAEEETSETPSTTEVSTEGSTEVQRYTTEYDRPRCDPRVSRLRNDPAGSGDCEPASEVVSEEKELPSAPAPAPSRVRFPDQRIQSYVKIPESNADRSTYLYPSWQLQEHPLIRGWPPSDQGLHRQYPPPPPQPPPYMWAEDANIWHRRFLQRD